MSPRDIPFIKAEFDKIDYVDKVWFKYMNIVQVHKEIEIYFREHTEYTHLMLISDDAIPKYEHIAMLMADAEKYDFPSISGVCCNDALTEDMFLNVTMDPVIKELGEPVTRRSYRCLPFEFTKLGGIIKIWFEGNNYHMLRRDVVEKVGLVFEKISSSLYAEAGDLTLSHHILQHYSQYADTRVYLEHFRFPLNVRPYKMLVGVVQPRIIEEKATAPVPYATSARMIQNLPKNLKRLLEFYYGPPQVVNLCIVTEFEQKDFFQWTMAFQHIQNTPHRFGGWFECSNRNGHIINLSSVIMNPSTISTYPSDDKYWNSLREADYVFVFCTRQNKKWNWYNLPFLAKEFMKPSAKMICQFDDEFTWLLHDFWNDIDKRNPKQFFGETKVLEVADAYLSVFHEPFWKRYCRKPVYYMPLPQLCRYDMLITVPEVKTTVVAHSSPLANMNFKERERNVYTLLHSIKSAKIQPSVDFLSELNVPIFVIEAKNLDEEIKNATIYGQMPREGLMFRLRSAYIAVDDNVGYIGWSRFAMECALSCVPCVGSTEAIKDFFPDLYTEPQDHTKQKELLERLLADEDFYKSQMACGWLSAVKKLSDANLVTKFLKILLCDFPKNREERDRVFIASTLCNEEHSMDMFMESLLNIDYPKELIDVLLIENNSSDNTWKMLEDYGERINFQCNYHSFVVEQRPCKFYNTLKKATKNDMIDGKTVDAPHIRALRNNHMIGMWNSILEEMKECHDYLMFFFADIVAPPNIVKKYIEDLKNHPECGWIGGVHHYRYMRHERKSSAYPNHFGLESPTLKIEDGDEIPPNYLIEWIYNGRLYGFPYRFAGTTEDEVLRRRGIGDGIFPVCCTGHVWMMPRIAVKKGFRFRMAAVEAGLAAEEDLGKLGYKMYCDSHIYLKHISIDGTIYRHDVAPSLPLPSSPPTKIEEKNNTKEVVTLREHFVQYLLRKFLERGDFPPSRPIGDGTTVFDNLSRRSLDMRDWDILYGQFRTLIDDERVFGECKQEALHRRNV
jgi:glycosyltransferase involved in cell wall biosynthesis